MAKRLALLIVLAAAATLAAAIYTGKLPNPLQGNVPQVGRGEPLRHSTSHIEVLEEATPLTPEAVAASTSATISIQPAKDPEKAVVFDKTSAQLGTTISLLLNSWQQGGVLPRQLANTASQLAERTGRHAVADAAAALRSATPREGPVTMHLLMLETHHTLALAPPEGLPENDAAAEAEKSWFRKQLEKLITIRTPDTRNAWSQSLLTAQQQIARGLVADASLTLGAHPLSADARLDQLRGLCKTYLSQNGKLTNLVNAYAETFLGKEAE